MITGHWDYRDKLPELVRICGLSSGVALPVPKAAPVTATMQAAMKTQLDATRESVNEQVAASKEKLQQSVRAAKSSMQSQVDASRESVSQQVAASKEKLQRHIGAATGVIKTHAERASSAVSALPSPAFSLPSVPCAKWSGVNTPDPKRHARLGFPCLKGPAAGKCMQGTETWPEQAAARCCLATCARVHARED